MEPTPGPWIDGNTGDSIIAPNATAAELAFASSDTLDYFGGVVVAESVSPRNKSLIKAAPRMMAALERIAAWEFDVMGEYAAEVRALASSILVEIKREYD